MYIQIAWRCQTQTAYRSCLTKMGGVHVVKLGLTILMPDPCSSLYYVFANCPFSGREGSTTTYLHTNPKQIEISNHDYLHLGTLCKYLLVTGK